MTLNAAHAHIVVRTAADCVLLIRRVRQGRVYYVAPGTMVLDGETPGAAAARVAGALGIEVEIEDMLHAEAFAGVDHFFFMGLTRSKQPLAEAPIITGFDHWELQGELEGSFELVELPRRALGAYDVRPWSVARRASAEPHRSAPPSP